MNILVFVDSNNLNADPYTTSKAIAENGEVEHHTVTKLIQTYEEDMIDFGILRFEIDKTKNGKRGRPEKIYKLNEQQATLLITYMQNTLPVRNFKKALVKEFFIMKKELSKRLITREKAKDKRNSLTEALDKLPNNQYKSYKYKHYTDLVYKLAFGKNTSQLRQHLNIDSKSTPRDYLSKEDVARVAVVENEIAVLIGLNYDYQKIKAMMEKKYVCE